MPYVNFQSNKLTQFAAVTIGGLMTQVVRCLRPNTGVPSLHLRHCMWVLWWMKLDLDRFFSGFLPFSPTTNFIPPFPHTHPIHIISFHQPLWWCNRHGWLAPLLFNDLQYKSFIASHPSTQPCVRHELRMFFYVFLLSPSLTLSSLQSSHTPPLLWS